MHSQNEEERVILEIVGDDEPSLFLDIGAWDGLTFSNTAALVERGWSGLMIEPGLEATMGLLKNHGGNDRVTILHAAVGFERSIVPFWNTPDAVGTTSRDHYEKWQSAGGYTGAFYTPVITLADIFNQFGGGWQVISIDAEGISVDLFCSLDLANLQPKVICVEHDERHVAIDQHAQASGYKRIYTSGENVVYAL